MAKKTFSEDFTWTITPKTKSTTLQYTGNTSTTVTISSVMPDEYRSWTYQNFATRNGNNLVITTYMTATDWDTKPTIKTTQTTFQDYFATGAPDVAVTFDTPNELYVGSSSYTIHPDKTLGQDFLFDTLGPYLITPANPNELNITTSDKYYLNEKGNYTYNVKEESYTSKYNQIFDLAGNDTFNLKNRSLDVVDYKGKDTYNIEGNDYFSFNVDDVQGNDTYNVSGYGDTSIYEYSGNDTYNFDYFSTATSVYLSDYCGNDKYFVNGVSGYEQYFSIWDNKGNDSYTIQSTSEVTISESYGNDKWDLSYTYGISSTDYSGNDKWAISHSSNAYIEDDDGNDKWIVSDIYKSTISDSYGKDTWTISDTYGTEIKDLYGNDKYIINDTFSDNYDDDMVITDSYGNDTYKFTSVEQSYDRWTVTDNDGKDNYTITDCYGVGIEEYGYGNNKYTVTNSSMIDLSNMSEPGKDTYTIKDSDAIDIYDDGGDDKYTLTSVGIAEIDDHGESNDTYSIKNLLSESAIDIYDYAGEKDSLTISGLSKKNFGIVFDLANYDDGSIYIVDTSTGGYVKIENFYEQNSDRTFGDLGNGCIEKIKAGVSITANKAQDYTYLFNSMQQDMENWFSDAGSAYCTVEEVLRSGALDAFSDFIVTADQLSDIRI